MPNTGAFLNQEEREACESRLGTLRDRLNKSEQFVAFVLLGIDELTVWDPAMDVGECAELKLRVALNSWNNESPYDLQVTCTALALLRDTLNDENLFRELVEQRGVRSIVLPWPPDVLAPQAGDAHRAADLLIRSHLVGSTTTDDTWAIRRWKGRPEIVHKG